MDDAMVDEYYQEFHRRVESGETVAQARRMLSHLMGLPTELVDKIVARFEHEQGLIRAEFDPGLEDLQNRGEVWFLPRDDHRIYKGLRSRLKANNMPESALEAQDRSTVTIMNDLRPSTTPEFDTRGLVLGHVQSGKTTHFMTLAARGADAGYRLIIVLTGVTENLRRQTQERLERDLVGTGRDRDKWVLLTSKEQDFSGDLNASSHLANPQQRLLAVVKKNPHRLRKLIDWLKSGGANADSAAILVIDDEADQASINISRSARASTINRLIREILGFPKAAYVAYTATPFANLLINPGDVGDLYPRTFIRAIETGEGYFGAEQLFGRAVLDDEEGFYEGLDVVRFIPDEDVEEVRPKGRAAADSWDPGVPDSLAVAIDWFLLATAARRLGPNPDDHSSMLIHTSMLTSAQELLADEVSAHVRARAQHLDDRDEASSRRLQELWEAEKDRVQAEVELPSWWEIAEVLPAVTAECVVVVDNSKSTQRLDYSGDRGETIIAVGGNTLSRGLTLEGLVCSYFVRSSSAYDTLLQMGRWFGYRRGYGHLVRIWMTPELHGWFRDLALVEAEVRHHIEEYATRNLTPSQLPVLIRTHPAMSVTSAARMRDARSAKLSYSGELEQTIHFDRDDAQTLLSNWRAGGRLLGKAAAAPGVIRSTVGEKRATCLYRDVPAELVLEFLGEYAFHPKARRLQPDPIRRYIEQAVSNGELLTWDVFVVGRGGGRPAELGPETVGTIQRSRVHQEWQDYTNIQVLTGSRDRLIGMSAADAREVPAKATDKQIAGIRKDLGDDRPMLGLYPIDKDSQPLRPTSRNGGKVSLRRPLEAAEDVLGLALFFPTSRSERLTVDYVSADLTPEEIALEEEAQEILEADLAAADREDEEADA